MERALKLACHVMAELTASRDIITPDPLYGSSRERDCAVPLSSSVHWVRHGLSDPGTSLHVPPVHKVMV